MSEKYTKDDRPQKLRGIDGGRKLPAIRSAASRSSLRLVHDSTTDSQSISSSYQHGPQERSSHIPAKKSMYPLKGLLLRLEKNHERYARMSNFNPIKLCIGVGVVYDISTDFDGDVSANIANTIQKNNREAKPKKEATAMVLGAGILMLKDAIELQVHEGDREGISEFINRYPSFVWERSEHNQALYIVNPTAAIASLIEEGWNYRGKQVTQQSTTLTLAEMAVEIAVGAGIDTGRIMDDLRAGKDTFNDDFANNLYVCGLGFSPDTPPAAS